MLRKLMITAAAAAMLLCGAGCSVNIDMKNTNDNSVARYNEDDYEINVVKCGGRYFDVRNLNEVIFVHDPGIKDGEFAAVTADVSILNGGEMHYINYLEIREVKGTKKIDFAKIAEEFDLPNADSVNTNFALKSIYTVNYDNSLCALVCVEGKYYVFRDGETLAKFSKCAEAGYFKLLCNDTPADWEVNEKVRSGVTNCSDYFILGFRSRYTYSDEIQTHIGLLRAEDHYYDVSTGREITLPEEPDCQNGDVLDITADIAYITDNGEQLEYFDIRSIEEIQKICVSELADIYELPSAPADLIDRYNEGYRGAYTLRYDRKDCLLLPNADGYAVYSGGEKLAQFMDFNYIDYWCVLCNGMIDSSYFDEQIGKGVTSCDEFFILGGHVGENYVDVTIIAGTDDNGHEPMEPRFVARALYYPFVGEMALGKQVDNEYDFADFSHFRAYNATDGHLVVEITNMAKGHMDSLHALFADNSSAEFLVTDLGDLWVDPVLLT